MGRHAEKRRRFPVEIVRRTRAAVGRDFMICFRLSMADLVEDGQTWDEIVALATEVEDAGATIINTGIGWHEARVPTIVTSVPSSAFVDISTRWPHVDIPVVASNRINMPQAAEQILAATQVQLISMARPLLADPDWVRKAAEDQADEINTCIACNQACLDHAFVHKTVTCLLNPRAGRETRAGARARPGVRSGSRWWARAGGPGGGGDRRRSAGTTSRCSRRGRHRRPVRLGAKDSRQGGVRRDHPLLHAELESTASTCGLDTRAGVDELAGFDDVVLATGVAPRMPDIPGIDHPMVLSYVEAIRGYAGRQGWRWSGPAA